MFDDEDITFAVVANHEEQYSIWPDFKEIPDGWIAVGPKGRKDECLDYIERVWTDMRPKSLRDKMRQRQENGDSTAVDSVDADLRETIEEIVSEHDDRLDEYTDGRPELYGWFVARAFEAIDGDVDPAAVRAGLNATLPPHEIPEEYA